MGESGAYNIISMASYWDKTNQENDHSIFVFLKMIINDYSLLCSYFIYFIVDNYDKYHFCIVSLIKFAGDEM